MACRWNRIAVVSRSHLRKPLPLHSFNQLDIYGDVVTPRIVSKPKKLKLLTAQRKHLDFYFQDDLPWVRTRSPLRDPFSDSSERLHSQTVTKVQQMQRKLPDCQRVGLRSYFWRIFQTRQNSNLVENLPACN